MACPGCSPQRFHSSNALPQCMLSPHPPGVLLDGRTQRKLMMPQPGRVPSPWLDAASSADRMAPGIANVIGSLTRHWWVELYAHTRFTCIPAWTLLGTWNDEWSRESGRPIEIRMFCRADRYVTIVWRAIPSSARNAAKQQSVCSDTGKGFVITKLVHME